MFGNFFKEITFADVIKDVYDLIKQHDLIETVKEDKKEQISNHAYTLNPGQTYWLINIFTKESELGEVPFKILYVDAGSWQVPNKQLEFVAPNNSIKQMNSDNLLATIPLRKWLAKKKKIEECLGRARHEYTTLTKTIKTANLMAESRRV